MSRSGYSEDCSGAEIALWRGAVNSAIKGKRGQAFLRELLATLDAMPEKRLASGYLADHGEYCAIGTVGAARGIDMSKLNVYNARSIAKVFGIAPALVKEIEFENDDYDDDDDDFTYRYNKEAAIEKTQAAIEKTKNARWMHMRGWVQSKINDQA